MVSDRAPGPKQKAKKLYGVMTVKRKRHGRERVSPGRREKQKKMKLVRLRELEPGSRGTISRLSCRGQLRRRLMDMGVVAGTPVKVERVAPLGDPVELKLKGFNLSLRKEEAGDIWVEVPEDE